MTDNNRYVRVCDLKQKIQYHPEIGTYVSEEDIDLLKRTDNGGIIIGKWEGEPLGNCFNCSHAKVDFKEGSEGWLNCPMWGAAGINPEGFCHMWEQMKTKER